MADTTTTTQLQALLAQVRDDALREALRTQFRRANVVSATVPGAVVVCGRRWQDRSGSTYLTARVFIGGQELSVPLQYGYGNHFAQCAREVLTEAGLVPPRVSLRQACEDAGLALHVDIVDVARKRDLHLED